jgi:serine/threonine protein kinase
MPPTAEILPIEPFLKTIARSGLVAEDRLQKAVKAAPPAVRQSPQTVAEFLVRTGVLTRFQADKLLTGTERGLVLGPFHILAPVGRGGMGAVYLGRDSRDQRLVALKVLPPQKYREEDRVLARFRREMEICQTVSHAHITRTFEAGVLNGVYYIAMEYVPGQTMRKDVAEHGPMPVARAAKLFAQVASALDYAHGQGLIHRDLKPSNIMLTPNGHAKILDLGLALIEGEDLPEDKRIVGGVGYVVGTMDYIAPEQVEDPTKVDGRADLYALGCSIYFVLTGQPPFPGGTSQQKIKKHLNEWPEQLTVLNPTIPAPFAKLIDHLMAKRPENRPASAGIVRQLLLPWAGDEPDLPMDTNLDTADPRAIFDLVTEQRPEGSFWESVAPQVFVPPKAKSAPKPDELEELEETESGGYEWTTPTIVILAVILLAGLTALLVGAVVLIRLLMR